MEAALFNVCMNIDDLWNWIQLSFPVKKYPGIFYGRKNKEIMEIMTAHN